MLLGAVDISAGKIQKPAERSPLEELALRRTSETAADILAKIKQPLASAD